MQACKYALIFTLCCVLAPEVECRSQAGDERMIDQLRTASLAQDPVVRANQRSQVFFKARDFRRVLLETDAGLAHDPQALELIWRSASSELWLGDGERALYWANRLVASVEHAELDDEARSSWLGAAEDYGAQAEELLKLEAKGRESLSRARLTVGLVALVAMGLIALLISRRGEKSTLETT